MMIIKNSLLIEYTYQYCHVILIVNVIIELQPTRALPHDDCKKKEVARWWWSGAGNAFRV